MNRRECIIVGLTGLCAVFGSGCLSNVSLGSSDLASIKNIEIVNLDRNQHAVHILVNSGNNLTHWSTYHLEPRKNKVYDNIQINNTWENKDGPFEVYARLDRRNTWEKINLSKYPNKNCYKIMVVINKNGQLSIAESPSDKNCS